MYRSMDVNYYDRLNSIKKSLDIAVKIDFTSVTKFCYKVVQKVQNAYITL